MSETRSCFVHGDYTGSEHCPGCQRPPVSYTPGPWRVGRPGTVVADFPVPEIGGSEDVAYYGGHMIAESVARQNAPILAAAPELLEALVMVRDADEDCRRDGLQTIPSAARARIDTAIAKAENRS